MSKGDQRRPLMCPQEQYDRSWLRLYGVECPRCQDGRAADKTTCPLCNGYGKIIEKGK